MKHLQIITLIALAGQLASCRSKAAVANQPSIQEQAAASAAPAPVGAATVLSTFCLNTVQPFITWQQMPVASSFKLYNRWGQEAFELNDPQASALRSFAKPPAGLGDAGTYFFVLTFTTSAGASYQQQGYTTYLGAECKE